MSGVRKRARKVDKLAWRWFTRVLFALFVVCSATAVVADEFQSSLRVRILQKFHPQAVIIHELGDQSRLLRFDSSAVFPQQLHFEKGFHLTIPGQDIERDYSGQLLLERKGDELLLINIVALEDYVTSVVLSEMGWQAKESMRAQAVLARTRALSHRKPKALYDFADLTSEQVYKGLFRQSRQTKKVLQATSGQVLKYQGRLAKVYYYGKCGERIYAKREIWGGEEVAYLKAQPLPYMLSEYEISSWHCKLPYKEVNAVFQQSGEVSYHISRKEGVLGIYVGENWLSIDDFRITVNRKLGWNKLKSNSFEFELKDGYFHFKGRGFGHLVGMCQQGSVRMAQKGLGYHDILQYFYPGTLVGRIDRAG